MPPTSKQTLRNYENCVGREFETGVVTTTLNHSLATPLPLSIDLLNLIGLNRGQNAASLKEAESLKPRLNKPGIYKLTHYCQAGLAVDAMGIQYVTVLFCVFRSFSVVFSVYSYPSDTDKYGFIA